MLPTVEPSLGNKESNRDLICSILVLMEYSLRILGSVLPVVATGLASGRADGLRLRPRSLVLSAGKSSRKGYKHQVFISSTEGARDPASSLIER